MLLSLAACTTANENPINLSISGDQRLIAGNYSLSTERFFTAYMSSDLEQRRLAEMYLIGVIDSAEGISWCDYAMASPDAIQEQAYLGLKNALKTNPKMRASKAITSRLEEFLPCKEQK